MEQDSFLNALAERLGERGLLCKPADTARHLADWAGVQIAWEPARQAMAQ